MTRKGLVLVLVILMTLNMITLRGVQAESPIKYDEVIMKIEVAQRHINNFKDSEELGHPVVKQLTNTLNQAKHQLEIGSTLQAIKKMENFQKHLNNPEMQKFITESAKIQLNVDAIGIMQSLDPSIIEYLNIVEDGKVNAVVVAPKNPDTTIRSWRRYGTNSIEKILVVSTKSYSGYHSLYMKELDDNSYGVLSNRVNVKEGEKFSASARIFLESGSAPYFQIRVYDAKGDAIKSYSVAAGTEGEWMEASLYAESIPAEAVTIGIFIRGVKDGSFYVDDVELKKEGTEDNLIQNPGFEEAPNTIADSLVEYVQKSSGVKLPVVESEPLMHDGINIYVGQSRAEDEVRHQALLQTLNDDGFIIDSQDNTITILGKTSRATEYGIADFLERYMGVRWLMPGPDGEHVPELSTIAIPKEVVQEEPAAISRHFFSQTSTEFNKWYKMNRMNHNIQFHHNMSNLFDPKVFADHPEYYADDVVPTHAYSWQPYFNDVTAEAAIQRIIEYFDANPNASSYSLGINDGTNYAEKEGHPDYPTEYNSVGRLHRSDYYCRWVNKVVEGVTEVYPDKYFGFLAYREMQDPPKNKDGTPYKLHPNVVPYITLDRLTWADPELRQAGYEQVEAWKESAENIGWYDYMYGAAYSLPRIYFHTMDENYKYAQEQNVIGHVAELYPNFAGEGPKSWIAAKLQWNPNQNVDELLQDWCISAVGEDAAPYLQQYYEKWEQFWTEHMLDSKWFAASSRNVYLNFNDISYLREITREELYSQLELLQKVAANAKTDQQKTRAEYFLRGFEYYEASVLSYPVAEDVEIPLNEADALELLARIIESYEMGRKRIALPGEFESDPILKMYGSTRGYVDGIQPRYLEALEAYIETEPEGGVVGGQLDQFLEDIGYKSVSARAIRTTAGKDEILQSLDFSQGPWVDAIAYDDFYVMNSENEPPVKTKLYLLWDDDNIYVGYENFDHDISKMIVSDEAPNGWWGSGYDDSVETYITDNAKEEYFGYFSNPKSVKFVRNQKTIASEIEWEVNAKISSDRWTTVQVIPFAAIGVDPNETKTLKGYFFRSYHGSSVYIGWDGGAPWTETGFRPLHLVD